MIGLPVSLVELSKTGGAFGADDIASEIKRCHKAAGITAPQWVLVRGDDSQMDNDLLLYLRVHTQSKVVAEVSGLIALGESWDRTPMFDHCAVRLTMPFKSPLRVQMIHSIVLRGVQSKLDLVGIHEELDRREFTGKRYVEGDEQAAIIVAKFGRGWRLTRPLIPES
jgi:hypothetical protein